MSHSPTTALPASDVGTAFFSASSSAQISFAIRDSDPPPRAFLVSFLPSGRMSVCLPISCSQREMSPDPASSDIQGTSTGRGQHITLLLHAAQILNLNSVLIRVTNSMGQNLLLMWWVKVTVWLQLCS